MAEATLVAVAVPVVPAPASGGLAAPEEVKSYRDHGQDKQHVNEPGRDMEREKTKHPQHEEHHCEAP